MEFQNKTINHGDYYLFSYSDFFGINDPVRLVKLLYILISFILNIFIIISIILTNKRKTSIALEITCNILFINFLHSLSYMFQWVIKKDDYKLKIKHYKEEYEVGGLLIGNLEEFNACKTQGFLLVFTSLSQDFLINIFFFMINKHHLPNPNKVRIIMIVLGYLFPGLFSLFYLLTDILGINDRFCFVKKFEFQFKENINLYQYYYFDKFRHYTIAIYAIRLLNLLFSIYLLIKIIIYVKENSINKKYIRKSCSLLLIQMVTVIIGVIYRIGTFLNDEFGRFFSDYFLYLNTLDSVLFPLAIILSNHIPRNLYNSLMKKEIEVDDEDDENKECPLEETTTKVQDKNDKTFAMIEIRDNNNNFDLSLTMNE